MALAIAPLLSPYLNEGAGVDDDRVGLLVVVHAEQGLARTLLATS
jgi:hypothetical protein